MAHVMVVNVFGNLLIPPPSFPVFVRFLLGTGPTRAYFSAFPLAHNLVGKTYLAFSWSLSP